MAKEIRNKEDIIEEIQWIKDNITETNVILDELEKELAEVERLEKKNKVWKPAFKESYWRINGFIVMLFTWRNYKIDNWNYSIGNCFKTEEEAERKKFELELEGKARLFQLENNEEIDWENKDKAKFYIYYSIQSKAIQVAWLCDTKIANKLGYFSSRELARQFVNENKEDLIKYFEGMK